MSHNPAITVAVLTPSLSRNAGGIFDAVRRNMVSLDKQGVHVNVLAPTDPFTPVDLPTWHPVAATAFPCIGPSKFGYSPKLRSAIKVLNPDVIHQHGLWTYASTISLRHKRGVVISPHGMLDRWALDNSRNRKRIAAALFETANLKRAACLHALNSREAASIRDFGLQNPIAITPNGADLPRCAEISSAKRPSWLPDDGRKVLLFLGRIHPKKGIAELLAAWAIFKAKSPTLAAKWRVVIAGWDDGDHLASLKKRVQNYMLMGDVIFAGPVYAADKTALFAHADAFILPSFSEGHPMSVLEAWSYALPVLMTDHCNLSFAFASRAAIEISTDPAHLAHDIEVA
ncbi:glycosyltransferase [Yoonia sp. MH D7]